MAKFVLDVIEPSEIGHWIDGVRHEGRLVQAYTVFDSHFEQQNAYCPARSYSDEMDRVAVYGPSAARVDLQTIANAPFEIAVHAYLKRRYRTVERM